MYADVRHDFHGTSAAGVAMARNNSVCGVGAAFEDQGSGIRLISAAFQIPFDDAISSDL